MADRRGAGEDATPCSCATPARRDSCSTATREGENGGSGRAFDWSTLPTGLGKPFVLAGGLHPDNVFDAIQADPAVGRGCVQRHRKRARDQGRG